VNNRHAETTVARRAARKIECIMNTFAKLLVALCAIVGALATSSAFGQTSTPQKPQPNADATNPTEAPDGSPSLPRDTFITHTTAESLPRDADASSSASESSEERIESRLAVIRSGRTTVTDPSVGRYDRAAGNGVRRVTPSMWQILRF
jgi:hypothetical protein